MTIETRGIKVSFLELGKAQDIQGLVSVLYEKKFSRVGVLSGSLMKKKR